MSKKRAKMERARLRQLGIIPAQGRAQGDVFLVPTGKTFVAKTVEGKIESFPVLQAFSPKRRALKALRAGRDPVEASRPKMPGRSPFERMFGPKRTVEATPAVLPAEQQVPITQSADSTPSPVEVATEAATTEGAE